MEESGVGIGLFTLNIYLPESNLGGYVTMIKINVVALSGREAIADPLIELLRVGAERLV